MKRTMLIAAASAMAILAGSAAARADLSSLGLVYEVDPMTGGSFYSTLGNLTTFVSALTDGIEAQTFTIGDLYDYFNSYYDPASPLGTSVVITAAYDLNKNWYTGLSFVFTSLTSSVSYAGLTNAGNVMQGTVTTNEGRAVPAPLAGAGIPAVLGLVGFGLYRRRLANAA